MAELSAMRARGEITATEFKQAKEYLAAELAGHTGGDKPVRPIWLSVILLGFWLLPYAFVAIVGLAIVSAVINMAVFGEPKTPSGAASSGVVHTGRLVSASDYGENWPYPPFDHGTIRCSLIAFGAARRPVITIELGSSLYGLNGPALSMAECRDPRPLIPTDEYGIFRGRIPTVVSEFIKIGNGLCP